MKSELWQRLKEARTRARMTQQDIADLFGLTRNAVSLWETHDSSKRTTPSNAQLKRIAAATGAPFEIYLSNDDAETGAVWATEAAPVKAFHTEDPAADEEIRIPEETVKFAGSSAGHLVTYEVDSDREPATYRLSWFQKERINPQRAKRFRVVGRSMEPMLYPGDSILVNMDETQIREGNTYVFRHGDELKVKKLIPRADGSLVLRSVNREEFPDDLVPAAAVNEQITIIGRVRDKSGRGGL